MSSHDASSAPAMLDHVQNSVPVETGNGIERHNLIPGMAPPSPEKRFSLSQVFLIAMAVALVALVPFALQVLTPRKTAVAVGLPAEGAVLWFADHETGDLSQWTVDQDGEAIFNTGTGSVEVSDDVAHGGQFGVKLSISDADGTTQAGRLLHWKDNPQEGYYSAWLYFPERYQPASWWNVFQFKSGYQGSDPMWIVNVGNREDGSMYLYLWDAINQRAYDSQLTATNLPVAQWVEVKAFYRSGRHQSGRITLWQDGVRLFDLNDVQTTNSDELHWGVSNYTDDIQPANPTIYVDDVVIRGVESDSGGR